MKNMSIKEQRMIMKKSLLENYEKTLDNMTFGSIEDEFEKFDSLLNPCFKTYIAGRKLQADSIDELRLLVVQEVLRLKNWKQFVFGKPSIYFKNEVVGTFEEAQLCIEKKS
jgi:hypothetical protein